MRKILKLLLILALILLLISVIAIVVLIIKNKSFIGSSEKEFVEYLENNKMVFDQDAFSTDKPLAVFNNDIYESDVILLGENHGYSDVQEIDKALFIHFNKTKGTRYYISETDSIGAEIINTFLNKKEKDPALLKEFVLYVKKRIPQQGGRELYQKWASLYDYNEGLADSSKIKVIGIDKNLNDKSRIPRDSAMVINFIHAVEKDSLSGESFYGFFGLAHVIQKGLNSNNYHYFAAKLVKKGFKVNSILCMDVDSEMYMPKNDQFPTPDNEKITFLGMDGPIVLVKGINDLKDACKKNTNTLFNLEGENSPYKKSQRLMNIKSNFIESNFSPYDENASTTDFIQYVMLLRNANAVTPME